MWYNTHMPDSICLIRVKLEVVVSKFQWRSSVQLQVCPATNEFSDSLKCVQRQTIIAVIGHMSHKHRHLDMHRKHIQTHRYIPGAAKKNNPLQKSHYFQDNLIFFGEIFRGYS